MRIKSVTLTGYKRLSLGGVEELRYTPEQKIQLILGTNGSGKSSLLKELSPLPADLAGEFKVGGGKTIEIEHKGSLYVLSNLKTESGQKHSFIKDGQELNISGKKSLQVHLVKEHFGLSNTLRDILISVLTFTSMSPAERKKIFIAMSDIDYDYAMGLYMKARSNVSATKSNIKMLQSRILANQAKVMNESARKELTDTIEFMRGLIESLLENKQNITQSVNTEGLEAELEASTVRLLRLLEKYKELPSDHTDPSALRDRLAYLKATRDKLLSDYNSTIVLLKEKKDTVDGEDVGELKDILEQIGKLSSRLNALLLGLPVEISVENSDYESYAKLSTLVEEIINIMKGTELPMSSAVLQEVNDKVVSLEEKRKSLTAKIGRIEAVLEKLEHSKNCEDITCPNCSHTWKPGYDPAEEEKLLRILDVLKKELEKVLEELNDLKHYGKLHTEFSNHMGYIGVLTSKDRNLSNWAMWLLCRDGDKITDTPNIEEMSNRLQAFNTIVLPVVDEYSEIAPRLARLKEKEAKARVWQSVEHKNKLAEVERLEETSTCLYKDYSQTELSIKALESKIQLIDNLRKCYKDTIRLLRSLRSSTSAQIAELRADTLTKLISELKLELNEYEQLYLDGTKAEPLIEADKKHVEELELQLADYVLLERALSPDKGVIADSIVMFINGFIREMNTILETVWEYPIEILPCNLEEGDLTYRFPVRVNDSHETKDVSATSSSMREIIDLAFKIVFMKANGLEDYPLYMDEFGKSMDEKHQSNAFKVIEVLANGDFEQIFLISHYEHCYGRFGNADVNVLHGANITNVSNSGQLIVR